MCGARGNHIERIAEDVAEHNREYLRGRAVFREPTALHRAHALPEGVHLHDVRPGGKQLMREIHQLLCGDQRLFKERAPAAREEKEHRVLRRQICREAEHLLRRRERVLVRHGVSRLHAGDAREIAHHMIVFRNHNPAVDALPEHVRRRTRHLPRRLADRGEHNAPSGEPMSMQRLLHCRVRQDCRQGLLDDAVGIAAQIHDHRSPFLYRLLIIAQISPSELRVCQAASFLL